MALRFPMGLQYQHPEVPNDKESQEEDSKDPQSGRSLVRIYSSQN